ncbi:hypothetical protein ACFWAT_12860 [Streptomyces syringium]|uniref:hypothetical protein n=1 Tax=Streptomyces syringium TaxID=76729 RepID=UPI003663D2EF
MKYWAAGIGHPVLRTVGGCGGGQQPGEAALEAVEDASGRRVQARFRMALGVGQLGAAPASSALGGMEVVFVGAVDHLGGGDERVAAEAQMP